MKNVLLLLMIACISNVVYSSYSDNCCSDANDVTKCNNLVSYTTPLCCPSTGPACASPTQSPTRSPIVSTTTHTATVSKSRLSLQPRRRLTSSNSSLLFSSKSSLQAANCGKTYCVGGFNTDCSTTCTPGHSCPPALPAYDNCVGATGVDCEGVQYDINLGIMGTISVGIVQPIDYGSVVTLKASVGAIYHDLCCRKYPYGAFCDSSNYPISQTLNLNGNANQNCACLMVWRKAAWNLLRGRYWLHNFTKAAHSSNLNPVSNTRTTWLPLGSGTNYKTFKSNWGITEVQATRDLCAPPNTQLDCPSEDNNCKVPCSWPTCKACASGCSSRHRKRWNKDGRNHATAGDAAFCCSGQFKEVYWSITGTRYGTCL